MNLIVLVESVGHCGHVAADLRGLARMLAGPRRWKTRWFQFDSSGNSPD